MNTATIKAQGEALPATSIAERLLAEAVTAERLRRHELRYGLLAELGPVLARIWNEQLFRFSPPPYHTSFKAWAGQYEGVISYSRLFGIVKIWTDVVPALEDAGFDPATVIEEVGEAKLRLLTSTVAKRRKTQATLIANGCPPAKARVLAPIGMTELINLALNTSWRDTYHLLRRRQYRKKAAA